MWARKYFFCSLKNTGFPNMSSALLTVIDIKKMSLKVKILKVFLKKIKTSRSLTQRGFEINSPNISPFQNQTKSLTCFRTKEFRFFSQLHFAENQHKKCTGSISSGFLFLMKTNFYQSSPVVLET